MKRDSVTNEGEKVNLFSDGHPDLKKVRNFGQEEPSTIVTEKITIDVAHTDEIEKF